MSADQSIGVITKFHGQIMWIEMNPGSHRPPPPFGTIVQCSIENETLLGIIFNAKIKRITTFPADTLQSPSLADDGRKQHRIVLVPELQAILIGSTSAGSDLFRQHFYHNPVPDVAVYEAGEKYLGKLSFDFSYFRTILNSAVNLPVEELLLTMVRKFSGYYPDKEKYSEIIYKELNLLYDSNQGMVNRIIDRTGCNVKIRT